MSDEPKPVFDEVKYRQEFLRLWIARAADKCGGERCPDDEPDCSCRVWAAENAMPWWRRRS